METRSLKDEKRLVAEGLMGWKVDFESPQQTMWISYIQRNGEKQYLNMSSWNPQIDRNCWQEIWEKMDGKVMNKYLNKLSNYFDNSFFDSDDDAYRLYHTAPSEVCWKALVEVLREGK